MRNTKLTPEATGMQIFLRNAISVVGQDHLFEIWPLNESSGTVVTGAIHGIQGTTFGGLTMASGSNCPLGYAAPKFDGVDDYIRISASNLNNSPLDLYAKGTAFALVRPDFLWNVSGSYVALALNAITDPPGLGEYLAPIGTGMRTAQAVEWLNMGYDYDVGWFTTYYPGPDSNWVFIVSTWDTSISAGRMFFDGITRVPTELNDSTPFDLKLWPWYNMLIGADYAGNFSIISKFKGGIAMVGIADRVLNECECLALKTW